MRITAATLLSAFLAAVTLAPVAAYADEASLADRVKAAFIFNFIQFVQWPAGTFDKPDDPLVLGVIGDSPVAGVLRTIVVGKAVDQHAILVRIVSSPADAARCNALFVPDDSAGLQQLLAPLRTRAVLTVGDPPDFTDAGGIIRFYIDDNKVRFEINTLAAERARLQISSKLLKLARIVRK